MEELTQKFPQLFTGIGKLKSHQIKLHIDPNVSPIAQPHRRFPFHLQQKVEDEINNLLEQDIIERVTGPTLWMSPIVTPIKPNNPDKVRICVDMRQANKAILRERHVTPTLQDIIHDLNGATIFSKLDLNSAYHQLELHPDSRAITNFSTNVGLFRYKRLLFGVSSSSEVFQHTISQVLNGIPGVNNISDDIIVYGKTVAEHNNNLRAVISRLVENGLTLNKEKCQLHKQSIEFYGHIFSADGVAVHPKHKTAILKIDRPQNVGDVRSFLSMISYSSRFIRDLATISEPLRNLIKQNIPWTWGDREEQSFRRLKQCLMDATFTSYFDPNKHTAITVDASPVGLSAILTQVDANNIRRVISYASRSLSDIEQRFSQTEREALACVWACEHYHRYIYGAPTFDLITDHQPLQVIYGNPRAKLPARIERWGLRLMPYSFKVVHCQGRQNPADYCSRHPNPSTKCSERTTQVTEEYINLVIEAAVPPAMTTDIIKRHTLNDQVLQRILSLIRSNKWQDAASDPDLRPFYNIRDELCTNANNDIILRGTRIVLPQSLHQQAINIAHEGHQGIKQNEQNAC